jgi:hypothetical protein
VRGLVERNLPGYVTNSNFMDLMCLMYTISFHDICMSYIFIKIFIMHN